MVKFKVDIVRMAQYKAVDLRLSNFSPLELDLNPS